MSVISCAHLNRVTYAVSNYNIILAYYVSCIAEGAFKRKAVDAYCRLCHSTSRRIHACLECAFFGCFDQGNEKKSHMEDHYLKNNHCLAININHGCLFCFECNDYIYNEIFEDIFNEYKLETIKINGNHSYIHWKPKAEEIALLKGRIKKISDDSYLGLRGIVNTAKTCYISVIIQSFIHNPVLRDFFLSDKHRCFSKEPCLACEMFVLFQEFYSGRKEPYVFSEQFILALLKCSNSSVLNFGTVSGDAHEFLLEILRRLHDSCKDLHKKDKSNLHVSCKESCETDNCNCMIHQTFYGIYQEFKECLECKFLSFLPVEDFMDIPLNSGGEEDSVLELLKRKFLEPQLYPDIECSNCGKVKTTHLHQTIKKLPTVICFHLNIFKEKDIKVSLKKSEVNEKKAEKAFHKNSTKYAFEEWIDMSPFLTSNVESNLLNGNYEFELDSYSIENRYKLFAVIVHKSDKYKINDGHYIIYVRKLQNEWYECNDHKVYKRTLDEVLACNPCLLFYYKQL